MGLWVNKCKKYYEYILTKINLIIHQKRFTYEGVSYKYLFEKAESDSLIVVFSSCTRRGIKARYNYVRTLKPFSVNKLFILDDFATDKRGSYYIGTGMSFNEEKAALELIHNIIDKVNAKTIICCGSSKGGWAALNFGLQIPGAKIIAGGPQYYLGTYLVWSKNLEALEHIVGTISDEKIKILDQYLSKRICKKNTEKKQKIYLHYSDAEHTYVEHVKDLVILLEEEGFNVSKDIAHYTDHSEISLYFPEFLERTLENIIYED